MVQTLSPSAITSAAVLIQLFLAGIAGSGAYLIDRGERKKKTDYYQDRANWGRLLVSALAMPLITLALLAVSDVFTGLSKDLTQTSFSIMSWQHSVFLVFVLDIIWTFILVYQTGGSNRSAFTSIYFILPSLAFFLREGIGRIIIYVVLIAGLFTVSLIQADTVEESQDKLPFWTVSILCLFLSLVIGYITRPR